MRTGYTAMQVCELYCVCELHGGTVRRPSPPRSTVDLGGEGRRTVPQKYGVEEILMSSSPRPKVSAVMCICAYGCYGIN